MHFQTALVHLTADFVNYTLALHISQIALWIQSCLCAFAKWFRVFESWLCVLKSFVHLKATFAQLQAGFAHLKARFAQL